MKTIDQLREAIKNEPARSAWRKGVKLYALDIVGYLEEGAIGYPLYPFAETREGFSFWKTFSYGGNALIWNQDIAARLCTNSEYKRTKEGRNRPNAQENWLDVQARALWQASILVMDHLY